MNTPKSIQAGTVLVEAETGSEWTVAILGEGYVRAVSAEGETRKVYAGSLYLFSWDLEMAA